MAQLYTAVLNGDISRTKALLQSGADFNETDKAGWTPLSIASLNDNNIEIAKLLIQAGADVDKQNNKGWSPLHHATAGNTSNIEIVNLLIRSGADVNIVNENGNTPLHNAASWSNIEIVKLLIDAGADIKKTEKNGRTPAQIASTSGDSATFALLENTENRFDSRTVQPDGTECAQNAEPDDNKGLNKNQQVELKEKKRAIVPLWEALFNLKLDRNLLTDFLNHPQIDSLECVLQTHNILLYSVRMEIVSLSELQNFNNDKDYIARNIYLPASKLISKYGDPEKKLFLRIVQHAEKVQFIADGRSLLVETATEFRIELESSRKEFFSVIVEINHKINDFNSRVSSLEGLSIETLTEFNKLCENNEKMVQNMQLMGNSLNDLHSRFQNKKKKDMYSSIVNIALALVPVIGPSLASAANLSEKVADASFSLGGGISGEFLDVDLSSWENVKLLASENFLNSLSNPEEKRVSRVIEQSKFGTPKSIQDHLIKYAQWTMDDEFLQGNTVDPDKTKLLKRFESITHSSINHTSTFENASKELCHVLNGRFSQSSVCIEEIEDKLEHYMTESGFIEFASFYEVYDHFASTRQKAVPAEIEEMFQQAVDNGTAIHKKTAKRLLKTLFDHSDPDSDKTLSFTRTTVFWDEESTYENFPTQVDYETFKQAAVRILFENPEIYEV